MSELIRRDPRIEWIRRNRLHPRHAELAALGVAERGPTGLLRKNPHGVGFIGPNGIKRIDRSAGAYADMGTTVAVSRGSREAAVPEKPLHLVETPDYYVAVVLDLPAGRLSSHDRDILGQAHRLISTTEGEGAVVAIALGDARDANFELAGADRLIHMTEVHGHTLSGYCPELKLAVLQAIEIELRPLYWLFPDSIHGGADLGSRLAVRLGERPAAHAWQVDPQQSLCRGGSQQTDWLRPTPRVLLLAEECALPVDEARYEARRITLESDIPWVAPLIEDLGLVAVDPSTIAMEEAEFILSAGNGVRDWEQFHEVAAALGAAEGASRVVVDDGFMPRFRQVGATGTFVTARVYIAVGISGAVQHLQGITRCDKVIAINVDGGCDMVKRADLSLIGDSTGILAELLVLAKARSSASDETTANTLDSHSDSKRQRHVA